jgi:hypothetical protein
MDALNKQARIDVFNNYPPSVMASFSGRRNELFDDSKVFKLLFDMNRLAFHDVANKSSVKNQSEDFEFANGIDFHYENGKPVFKGV